MKLDKSVKVLLASSILLGAVTAACGDETATNDGGAGASGDDVRGDDGTVTGPQCDDPGSRSCTGSASGIVCAEGSTNAVPFFCATGEVCDDGECVGQCEGGATECVGDGAMRVCAADGREWVTLNCAEGTSCQDGECLLPGGLVCTPGEKKCADTGSNQTCKSDGSGWEDAEECPAESACTDGECVGSVCVVGASRCDIGADDWAVDAYDSFFFEGPSPDISQVASTVYRCVDGSEWVAEPCADETFCSYTSFTASETAAYHAEVSSAFWQYAMFEGAGEPPYAPPPSPDIPDNSSAECVAIDCEPLMNSGPESYLLFGQNSTRVCGDVTLDTDPAPWTSTSECRGFPILSPVTTVVTSCAGDQICNGGFPTGASCTPLNYDDASPVSGQCYPGEIACYDGDSYSLCNWYGSSSGWSTYDCPLTGEPAAPGACVASGSFPARSATCGGNPISIPD